MNLIRNAIKFTSQGSIELKVMYDGPPTNMLHISVHDTGSGIAAEDMSTLFTKFGKLQRTATMNSEGIGLGLTICK